LQTHARQPEVRINVFRRPRTFPAAVAFGPWKREDIVARYVCKHDLVDNATGKDDVTDLVTQCYNKIEAELADEYAVDLKRLEKSTPAADASSVWSMSLYVPT
jgi:hypothetical protein